MVNSKATRRKEPTKAMYSGLCRHTLVSISPVEQEESDLHVQSPKKGDRHFDNLDVRVVYIMSRE
jgi:hypothetical protein